MNEIDLQCPECGNFAGDLDYIEEDLRVCCACCSASLVIRFGDNSYVYLDSYSEKQN